ncbi:MAG: PACE efflux transporter [Formosimonas sp.]
MTPIQRRVLQTILYETIAVAVVGPVLAWGFDKPLGTSLWLAVCISAVALVWGYLFNGLFEYWETRQTQKGRSLTRRVAHSLGFEGGLIVFLVPLMAWWLDISLWQSLLAEIGFLLFFMVYAFVFTWVFDAVFGLPQSAQ